ncbi:unnamed protein product, partial [Schistocephalus solidus]|uniref:C2H2-type domain-containing protein n=1 Tax=Schistocephalus solidus TaxID=70667 RepID=A0A183TJ71_SCHSO
MLTTPTTDNHFMDAPPPTITDTILPPPLPSPITAINTTWPTLTTSVATSDYLPHVISNTTVPSSTSNGDSVLTCPHCDRTFTSHTFTHRMGLLGHMSIHESGIPFDASISCAPINTSHIPTMSRTSSRATTDSAPPDLSFPHCHRTSRIGLVDHLRIRRTETDESVPGAPTYTCRTRFNCPHHPRTFTYHMDLLTLFDLSRFVVKIARPSASCLKVLALLRK